jgi:hypothetical protein
LIAEELIMRNIDYDMKTTTLRPEKAAGTTVACPSYFVTLVLTARASRTGYEEAGYQLAIHAREELNGEADDYVLDDLDVALGPHPARGERLWAWFQRALPRCMALVPSRRKETFLRGVERARAEGRI